MQSLVGFHVAPGERGALAAGAIGNLLPGYRPVTDSAARVDLQSAWVSRPFHKLLVDQPQKFSLASMMILLMQSLWRGRPNGYFQRMLWASCSIPLRSIRISISVTAIADVVLPVAAVIEKSGSYLDWRGSARNFDKGVEDAQLRSDVRVLSMLADELGSPINLPTVTATAREIESLGTWDGVKPAFTSRSTTAAVTGEMTLVSWRFLLDLGTLQQGEANLAGTAKQARAHLSATAAASIGVNEDDFVVISSERGSIELPVSILDIADNLIWVPRNSEGSQVIPSLGFTSGAVKVTKK
ncbi:MAG: hypothetical protein WDN07_01070 [Actinomycetota bacterium]